MRVIYNKETKSFSLSPETKTALKTAAIMGATAASITFMGKLLKKIAQSRDVRMLDEALIKRNSEVNKYLDNNYVLGMAVKNTPASIKKYESVLHDLYQYSLKYHTLTPRYQESRRDVYETYYRPFGELLRVVLLSDFHVIHPNELGTDKRFFEIVFAPQARDARDVAKDPRREVRFKYAWPDHGFNVKTDGAHQFDGLVDATFKFLAKNPQMLSIRV